MAGEKLALFDFDDTLCRGDSIVPYVMYCIWNNLAPKEQLWKAIRAYFKQRRHPERAAESKAATLSFIKGQTQEKMDHVARAFFRDVLSPRFFEKGQEEIARLKTEGYRVVVISASADVYMRVLPEFMPVDAVIATTCVLDRKGCYTGEISVNCKGDVKPQLLAKWLGDSGVEMDAEASCAYGDSPSDAPMLRLAGKAFCVGKPGKLRKLVPGMTCVDWRKS